MAEGAESIRRRTGGRSARIREQVFGAVLQELVAHGLSGLTLPAIAQRAGVHPTTLYRRWPDPEALALDAIRDRSMTQVAIPDTGTLAGDLTRFLTDLDAYVRSPLGRALLALQLTARGEADRIRQAFWRERFELSAAMIERAKSRGEIPATTAPRPLLEFAIAPVYLHAAVLGDGLDQHSIALSVRRTIALAQAG
ncbi:TetR/AcrR family transcriptional regulator C-terminal ligand-binding domain-containing protein [Rhodopseudomonas palustris]|uniref:TetR/AcrR family transcriptional regulator C-terminal ligand-binding domain-containing protein n=1 Tax=Rhodopseudomonas palustris TaxID=1076 RepID=UPI0021F327E3|nr:TetR/AcrR family transcriptional regulator C-terminal ligand-binding domain-containing protein [Rhodopseudomonas palustris]UYO55420.1 TetR/AcrR family transcriptional regulator C-terminal ligand-binding domain-containing protein [Rhodopseudomonas palustris]